MSNEYPFASMRDSFDLSAYFVVGPQDCKDRPLTEVNDQLEAAKVAAFELGVSRGIDPFMTLSFMALPVIPKLRITTRGVIDVDTQQYV